MTKISQFYDALYSYDYKTRQYTSTLFFDIKDQEKKIDIIAIDQLSYLQRIQRIFGFGDASLRNISQFFNDEIRPDDQFHDHYVRILNSSEAFDRLNFQIEEYNSNFLVKIFKCKITPLCSPCSLEVLEAAEKDDNFKNLDPIYVIDLLRGSFGIENSGDNYKRLSDIIVKVNNAFFPDFNLLLREIPIEPAISLLAIQDLFDYKIKHN